MSATKTELLEWIQVLPEDCSVQDVRDYLDLREKVEAGIKAAEEGRVVSQEEAERRTQPIKPQLFDLGHQGDVDYTQIEQFLRLTPVQRLDRHEDWRLFMKEALANARLRQGIDQT